LSVTIIFYGIFVIVIYVENTHEHIQL